MERNAKISKAVRAMAIEGLELAASNFDDEMSDLNNLVMWLDGGSPEYMLAADAWTKVPVWVGSEFGSAMLQEAADLLFDGWSPGEPLTKYWTNPTA